MVFLDEIRGRGTTKDIYRSSNMKVPNPFDVSVEGSEIFSQLLNSYNFLVPASELVDFDSIDSQNDDWLEEFILPNGDESDERMSEPVNEPTIQDKLDSPTALSILTGIRDVLSEWVRDYGDEANKTYRSEPIEFSELPKNNQDLLNETYHQLGSEPDFPKLPPDLALKIGEYTAEKLLEAIPFISVSGEVMSQSQLEYRFRFGFKYQDSFEFQQRTFFFMAFGTKWYPSWQFHCLRGDTWEGMEELLHSCNEQGYSIIDIMKWSQKQSKLLEGLSPSDWIKLGRPIENAIRSISIYDERDVLPEVIPRTWLDHDYERLEPMTHSQEIQEQISCLSESLATITTNKPALQQYREFMESIAGMDITRIRPKVEPRAFGTQLAKKTMSSYFQFQAFNHVMLSYFKECDKIFPNMDEKSLKWLGIQTVHYMYTLTNRMATIGPAMNENEVLKVLDDASSVPRSRNDLLDLKNRNQLISIEIMDEELYPSWQIDQERHQIRPIVRTLLPLLESQDAYVNPYAVMAWANNPETEFLGGVTPAEWIIRIDESTDETADEKAALWDAAKILVQRYFY